MVSAIVFSCGTALADMNQGRGTGVVIATGTQTEFGVIFSMMQDVSMSHLISFK